MIRPGSSGASRIRIGTWNTDYGIPTKVPALRARMAEHPADVWVLTETRDALKPRGTHYRLSSPRRNHEEAPKYIKQDSRWVSVWSRYPLRRLLCFRPAGYRTVVALIDLSQIRPGMKLIVYGTVLPEKNEIEHAKAIAAQSADWRRLLAKYPKAVICIAGDYNTDMGRSADYGLRYFYGPKGSTQQLLKSMRKLNLRCITAGGIPRRLRPKHPPIDHTALSDPHHRRAQVVSVWAGSSGIGHEVQDRIGLVVEVPL